MLRDKIRKTRSERILNRVSRIRLRVRGRLYEFNMDEELSIVPYSADILDKHTERFFFWRRMLAEHRAETRKVQQLHDEHRAAFYQLVREALLKREDGAVTDKRIESEVTTQVKMMKSQTRLNKMRDKEELLESIVAAFDHRRAMLLKKKQDE